MGSGAQGRWTPLRVQDKDLMHFFSCQQTVFGLMTLLRFGSRLIFRNFLNSTTSTNHNGSVERNLLFFLASMLKTISSRAMIPFFSLPRSVLFGKTSSQICFPVFLSQKICVAAAAKSLNPNILHLNISHLVHLLCIQCVKNLKCCSDHLVRAPAEDCASCLKEDRGQAAASA